MHLEMYFKGKFIDSIPISSAQLGKIHELQHLLETKYCNELNYSDDQPQFFVNGIPSGLNEYERNKLQQGLRS